MFSKPLFCFLLALHVPLIFFADNQSLFEFSGVIRTLVLFQACTVVLFYLGKIIFGSDTDAGAIAGAPLIFFWIFPINVTYAVFSALGYVASLFVMGRLLDQKALIKILNAGAAGVLLLQPVLQIAFQTFSDSSITVDYSLLNHNKPSLSLDDPIPKHQSEPPTILHMTLDAYANDTVLYEVIGFDNSGFSTALKNRGFIIFENAVAPYNRTIYTMPSVFSGEYLDLYRLASFSRFRRKNDLQQLTRLGYARKTLSDFNYTFVYNANRFFSSRYPKGARVNRPTTGNFELSNYEYVFLIQRGLSIFHHGLFTYKKIRHLLPQFSEPFMAPDSRKSNTSKKSMQVRFRSRLSRELEAAFNDKFIATLDPPFLYALHVNAPHPPFTIDRDGNSITKWSSEFGGMKGGSDATRMQPELQKKYSQGYAEKLLYSNQATLKYIDRTLELFPHPLIIIIHGDHGSGVLFDVDSPENSCLRERFSPYLAIYSSSPKVRRRLEHHASSQFNLVNIYRVLFDELFEQDVQLQESHSFFVPHNKPHDYIKVDQDELGRKCELPW